MAKVKLGIQDRIDKAQNIALNPECVNMQGRPVERSDVRELALQLVEIWTWINRQSEERVLREHFPEVE